MLVKLPSVAILGLKTVGVEVEINLASKSFPSFNIVGLPNKAIDEAKERVRTALINSSIEFPQKRITVNLAPADLPKEGSCYDLPIALGIISLTTGLKLPEKSLFYGELSLDGQLRHTKGAFLAALWARENQIKDFFVAKDSAQEAAVVEGIRVYPIESLSQLVLYFYGQEELRPLAGGGPPTGRGLIEAAPEFDFADILGQEQAKRAAEIAAAGGHNLFLEGVPGAGKTMIARALPGILPPLTTNEALEVTKIYSVAGKIPPGGGLITQRPFRAPHHTISRVGLIGGGSKPRPGEISLAHRGVLFLDELAEFPRSALEALRQPLEDGQVTISRAIAQTTFPAQFMLIAAANPCPCGFLAHPTKECRCSPREIARYRRKLSGPLLDRIDLYVNVPPVETEKLTADSRVKKFLEPSAQIQARVVAARKRQTKRFRELPIETNAEMNNKLIRRFCSLTNEAEQLLKQAISQFDLSARAYFRVIKAAQTIADLAGEEKISPAHIAEALQYRIKN